MDQRIRHLNTLVESLELGPESTALQLYVQEMFEHFVAEIGAEPVSRSREHDVIVSAGELAEISAGLAPSLSLPSWALESYNQLTKIVARDGFPCIFARRSNHMRTAWVSFVDDLNEDAGREHVRKAVLSYLGVLKRYTEARRTMMPLLVMVRPVYPHLPLDAYHAQAWKLFQYLHDHDVEPWPSDVPTDPDRGDWSFCFAGGQLFSNVSAPAHERHKSRNLGDSLVFVMQPRKNFDVVAGNNPKGRVVRAEIRRRLQAYEGNAPPSELGYFGTDENREWKQMTLHDGEKPSEARCPFHHRQSAKKE